MSILEFGNPYYVDGNPNNFRTWLRISMPRPVSSLIEKGNDCEKLGSSHLWYNIDNENSGCYLCTTEKAGQLWK
mgnify:CR=1 FL=1